MDGAFLSLMLLPLWGFFWSCWPCCGGGASSSRGKIPKCGICSDDPSADYLVEIEGVANATGSACATGACDELNAAYVVSWDVPITFGSWGEGTCVWNLHLPGVTCSSVTMYSLLFLSMQGTSIAVTFRLDNPTGVQDTMTWNQFMIISKISCAFNRKQVTGRSSTNGHALAFCDNPSGSKAYLTAL